MPAAKRLFYGYFFFGGLSVFLYYFFGQKFIFEFISGFLALSLISYILYYILKSAFHGEPRAFIEFFIVFLYKWSIFLSFCILGLGFFSYYQNDIYPAKLPLYTLSNGQKIIKFQTMSHVGRKEFYDSIVLSIGREKANGYILFYEGVKAGSEKNMGIFQKLIGFDISKDFYEKYSKIYGVTAQDNKSFLGIRNKRDFNVDLSIDRIIELYAEKTLSEKQMEEYKKQSQLGAGAESIFGEDIANSQTQESEILDRFLEMEERPLMLIRYWNMALLNFFIKHANLQDFAIEKIGKKDIFSIILDARNENLARELELSKSKKIYVLYGLLHFEGVFQILQEQDTNWKIIETSYFYPISSPNIPSF